MKKVLSLLFLMILLIGCNSPKTPIFKDLYFGMSYDEVLSKGFCSGTETEENGYSTYECTFSDFAGLHYNSAKLHFKNNKFSQNLFLFFQQKTHQNKGISLNL